ncbi:MAG: enoyl-CoA hydratase/isomerase family protein [Acidobacteriaceae bacterium]|nr:enoyl-CoA hydratase/isomerase family protein [Acidobacteriaceae bacterium]
MRAVAILGAGTMGAQIAAHFANAGIPALLLDLTADIAKQGLARARALKPDPFFTASTLRLISTGGFDTDLDRIRTADWVLEAIVENLDVKRALFSRIEPLLADDAIVSSNTSGIPIGALADGQSEQFQRQFLGTHFFNPPRYLRLLELIPTAATHPDVLARVSWCAEHRLGKGVVVAKDAPGFIANRIGLYGVAEALRALEHGEYTVEEIDAITGPAIGRPKSATFRTMDIAGIDILKHVAGDLAARLTDAESARAYTLPPIVTQLVERGWVGEKTGKGFYTRDGANILALDPATMSYRERQAVRIPSLDRGGESAAERVKAMFSARDKAGAFLRATLSPLLLYTAEIADTISDSIDDIDRAMQWGFGWQLGPFQLWDAIGIDAVLDAATPARVPTLIEQLRAEGRSTIRGDRELPASVSLQILPAADARARIVKKNPSASLVDLGDDVLGVALHSKLNVVGEDVLQMLHAGVAEASRNYAALVIGTDAADFSAGANLMLLLMEARDGNWDEIDLMVRRFQQATSSLRYADVPVVVAATGLTLGGGCEISLHGAAIQAAAETYIGLVEVGVGLVPAGGGAKELVARASASNAGIRPDPLRAAEAIFQTIGFAKVSTSGTQARELGLLRESDRVTMNRDHLIADAKATALSLARAGYQRPVPPQILVGGESVEAALKLGVHLALRGGRISEHDARIGRKLAHIIAGGSLPHATTVSESHLLDLEREAFLALCGEAKTLERIQYTLKTGKTLRN